MEAGKRTISDIFNGSRILEIPFFQRAYVWDTDQWERLLEDMESVSRNSEPYFLGSVILKQQPTDANSSCGDLRTVIDGQQRLTTLSIFFKVLCLKKNEETKFDRRFCLDDGSIALRHNHNDVKAFDTIMELTELNELDGKDNISRAYTYFKNNLDHTKIDFQAISSKVLFVGIDLTADEDEQQIFDTINSLGVKLTTAELLKNYFFGRDNTANYDEYWKDVFERDEEIRQYWDQEITTGRLKRTFIDLFFFSFLQIKLQDGSKSVKTEDKVSFSKADRLFDSYKRFIKEYYGDDRLALLEEIREYALLFKSTFDNTVVDSELNDKPGIERINILIFAMETTTLVPYVLYLEHNISDDAVKNELYAFIESYIMRRVIARETTKNYNQLFTDRLIFNHVLSKQDFTTFLDKQNDKVNHFPNDTELYNGIFNSKLTNKQATGVLYLIESKIRNRDRYSTQLLGINKYSLEHIMPKKWQNHWDYISDPQKVDERNRKLLTIGNLAIITQALNSSIRDSDWNTKKNGRGDKSGLKKYAEGIETLFEFLEYDKWSEETIDVRAEYLYKKAIAVWVV